MHSVMKETGGHIALPQQLPGVDIARGLRMLAGNEKMYLTLLRTFVAHHSEDDVLIKEALSLGRRDEAQVRVHTLKGLVGAFGAMELGAVTKEFEQQLLSGDEADVQHGMLRFSESFGQVLESLHLLIGTVQGETDTYRGGFLDEQQLSTLLQQFVALVHKDLGAALPILDAIDVVLANTALHDEGQELRTLFEGYELEQAEVLARRLLDRVSATDVG